MDRPGADAQPCGDLAGGEEGGHEFAQRSSSPTTTATMSEAMAHAVSR